MTAFKISLNGKTQCLAGLAGHGVLNATVTYIDRATDPGRTEVVLNVSGLNSPAREHLNWLEHHPITVGDKVCIEIVAAGKIDQPLSRRKSDPKADLRAQKQYVRKMARQWRWKITTPK